MGARAFGALVMLAIASAGDGRAQEPVARSTRIIGDKTNYFKGSYTGYSSPFNKGALVSGVDYTETIIVDPKHFPDRTTIRWSWPAPYGGIRGFLAVDYGNYFFTAPPVPVTPRQVSAIRKLVVDFDIVLGGAPNGYDAIIDLFLTSAPGDSAKTTCEIEIFLHTPAYSRSYADHAGSVGTFVDARGRSWTVSRDAHAPHGPDILVSPSDQSDVRSGSIDLKALLAWLATQGVVDGKDYVNGLGLGAEPQAGRGSLTINKFSVDLS